MPSSGSAVLVHALRVSLSANEYKLLYEHVIKRCPSAIQRRVPTPSKFDTIVNPGKSYNEDAIRASLRVFLATAIGSKLFNLMFDKVTRGRSSTNKSYRPPIRYLEFRLALSLALVLFLHRVLYRSFVRLRLSLRSEEAEPFRRRNPGISRALTSRYSPAIGASIAGFALGICPQHQLRITLAIYTATKSLEFLHHVLDKHGWFKGKPWWFGSWLLMPLSCAQLFHAFVFDRETTPQWFGTVIVKFSTGYIQCRPSGFPAALPWPEKYEIVDSLATIANLKWPRYISPILHPTNPNPLPRSVGSISPVTSPAHPLISSLSCALLHSSTPGCSTAFLHHVLLSLPRLARVLAIVAVAASVVKYKSFLAHPVSSINASCKRVLKISGVLSVAVGLSWGSICFLNRLLPHSVLPTQRFFINGAIGGFPFVFLRNIRGFYLYVFRAAVYSAWRVRMKRGICQGWKVVDLWLFVLSWALIGVILEGKPSAVKGKTFRKCITWLRGSGPVDPTGTTARCKAKKVPTEKTY